MIVGTWQKYARTAFIIVRAFVYLANIQNHKQLAR
jgi:hypothetical protein